MKAKESLLHKNLRAVVQTSVRKEANEPCVMFWNYQPHRPEKPLTNPHEKTRYFRSKNRAAHTAKRHGGRS